MTSSARKPVRKAAAKATDQADRAAATPVEAMEQNTAGPEPHSQRAPTSGSGEVATASGSGEPEKAVVVTSDDAPLGGAAAAVASPATEAIALHVTALRAGFRRAGRAWPAERTPVAAGDLSEEQIAQLQADPMFLVEV